MVRWYWVIASGSRSNLKMPGVLWLCCIMRVVVLVGLEGRGTKGDVGCRDDV